MASYTLPPTAHALDHLMTSQALTTSHADYQPQAIWDARHAFFDEGKPPVGLVHDGVLRSWLRCSESGRGIHEPVEFQPIDRQRVRGLLETHAELLDAARDELADLAASVADAGYAVLLTDVQGNALAVDGAIAQRSGPLRSAFRTGVDLSEAAIGTNAMAVAMREAQPIRVQGPEHFYTEAQIFHCSAAPVFGAQGAVVGAVDVSRDLPGMRDSALWLAARCAHRIEKRLFCRQPAHVHVEIDVSGGMSRRPSGSGAWLAFGSHGELVAANRAARSLLGLPSSLLGLGFERLFEERFGAWVSTLRHAADGAQLRMQDGVRLMAMPLQSDHGNAGPVALAAPARSVSITVNSGKSNASPVFGDPALEREFERARRAMKAGLPILITGETGTGKDVAARALHAASARASGPFIALNCAAVPGELLAGELFGHVEGAFTGSRRSGAAGKIEAAHGGTLFLDEIGDMPLPLQAALLRVLEAREVTRLGCNQPRKVDFQVLCATHQALPERVDQGLFREDLLYRVAGHVLHLTALRDRADFDAVLDALLHRANVSPARATPELRAVLRARPWRGNVRELAHAIQRAVALSDADQPLSADDFDAGPASVVHGQASQSGGLLKHATDEAIQRALRQAGGNVTAAAKLLGMGRATLYRRLQAPTRGSSTPTSPAMPATRQ